LKTSGITVVAIAATLMLCALFASTASAVVPAANAPIWSEGDSWAIGKSMDLDTEFSEQLDHMEQMLQNMTGSTTLDEFNVQATASAWLKVEVTSVTADEYVVQGKVAMRFNAEANVAATGEMPAAGTKAWDDMNYPTAIKTISVDAAIDMAFVSETTTVFDKSSMAIKSIETTNKGSMVASIDILNLPETKFNFSDMSVTYSYRSIDASIDFDMTLNVDVSFAPALNLIEFPLSVGDTWNLSSLASVTGSVSGFLDVKGLSSADEEMLFDNQMLQDAGITEFPIDFSKLSTEGEPKIVNGTLVPLNQYVNATMECTGLELVTLPVYGEVAIYEITMNGGSEKFYYSDDVHFLTGVGSSLEGIDLPDELSGIPLPEANMTMNQVTSQEAEQNIDAITNYQTDLSGQASGSGDGLSDLLGILPMIALILVIVIVAVVVAVVMVKRKKK
jgi:hypothetical protein